jgi:hypothetical protein
VKGHFLISDCKACETLRLNHTWSQVDIVSMARAARVRDARWWRCTLSRMAPLAPKDAFLHVIDDHRWLAASGCAWNLVGPNATSEIKEQAHRLLPNIDVAILDSLLAHARSLIDFYTNPQPRRDDITLRDFNLSLDPLLSAELGTYKKPIELHSLHLTHWRDYDFRMLQSTGRAATGVRPDWNREARTIVELILEKALKNISEQGTIGWASAFKILFAASTERYRNKSSVWPTDLSEKSDVAQFLTCLGL